MSLKIPQCKCLCSPNPLPSPPILAPFLHRAPLRAALGGSVDATGLCSAAENWGGVVRAAAAGRAVLGSVTLMACCSPCVLWVGLWTSFGLWLLNCRAVSKHAVAVGRLLPLPSECLIWSLLIPFAGVFSLNIF